jgi:F1F0 ATPase subunit 2
MTPLAFAAALFAGSILGFLFFGGLWLTVHWAQHSRHPGLITVISFWLRTLLMIAGLLLILKVHWMVGVVYLLGFTLTRAVFTHFIDRNGSQGTHPHSV